MRKRLQKHRDPGPCVPSAWTAFAGNLAQILEGLQEDQYLILVVKRSNRYIQFAGQGEHGLQVETTSNHYLGQSEQLTEQQVARLRQNGWNNPTRTPETSPEDDPQGSPNFFIDYPLPVPYQAASELVIATFATILQIPHPGYLEYEAFDADRNSLAFPALAVKRRTCPADKDPEQTRQRLLATIQEFTGLDDLAFDQDGDIILHFGSAAIFVRYQAEPPLVRLHAPVLSEIGSSPGLLIRLNELNTRGGDLHFFHHQGRVVGVADVHAAPFIAEHVIRALKTFSETVDEIDDILAYEFGGKTATKERMVSLLTH